MTDPLVFGFIKDPLVFGLAVCGIITGLGFICGAIFHAWLTMTGRIKPWPHIPQSPEVPKPPSIHDIDLQWQQEQALRRMRRSGSFHA